VRYAASNRCDSHAPAIPTVVEDTTSTIQKVIVPPEDVRDSGLLKDRIIIHYPDIAINADMTMFKSAVENWWQKCARWLAYCEREDERPVNPILVIQVEDGTDRKPQGRISVYALTYSKKPSGGNFARKAGQLYYWAAKFRQEDLLPASQIQWLQVEAGGSSVSTTRF